MASSLSIRAPGADSDGREQLLCHLVWIATTVQMSDEVHRVRRCVLDGGIGAAGLSITEVILSNAWTVSEHHFSMRRLLNPHQRAHGGVCL